MHEWVERAGQWGIEIGYFDVEGQRHDVGPEALRGVIEALAAAGLAPSQYDAAPQAQPQPAFQGDGQRTWVLAVQLYGVSSRRNWGHGDFTDLARLVELVANAGGAGVGLNPLHALFYDRPGTASPYSPSSRLFLNPLYIDVEAVAEFRPGHAAHVMPEIDRLRSGERVDYAAVAKLKISALRDVYREFASGGRDQRREDFAAYRRERGRELELFAAFETLRVLLPDPWPSWPAEWQRPDDRSLRRLRDRHADDIDFHEFLQWNAERQLQRCRDIARQRGLPIGLYLDTALGVDPSGADAWIDRDVFLGGLSVGAPPDPYNSAGQDWGLTAYNPHALVARGFEPFRALLRAAMRYAGAVRLDHVLGLMRLFVIPRGVNVRDGVYLRFPFAAMLDVVAQESRRWRCIVIGEDLGTVPDNFRETLWAWGVWSYLVMLFERNADGSFRRPADYPELAIATFGTHDLPTFTGWIGGHDLGVKRAIGLDPGETDDQRERARAALGVAVAGGGTPTFEDAVAFLAATPTRLLSIAVEDVLEMADQVNVPGTVDQHANWRRRWPITLDELVGDPRLHRIAATLARAGRGSPRRP